RDKLVTGVQTCALPIFLARLKTPGSYQIAPYHLPTNMKTHGVAMNFALFFFELGELLSRDDMKREALDHAYQVLRDFWQPDKNRSEERRVGKECIKEGG